MRSNPLTRLTRVAIAAVAAGCAGLISHPVSNLDTTPTNDLPNPYRSVSPWGNLPTDHSRWGAFNGVAIDYDGRSVWVVDRCGANPDVPPGASPFQYDSCAGSSWAPVHKLDADGNILKSFGAGLFVFPHKIYVDRDSNVWVVDMRAMNARARREPLQYIANCDNLGTCTSSPGRRWPISGSAAAMRGPR